MYNHSHSCRYNLYVECLRFQSLECPNRKGGCHSSSSLTKLSMTEQEYSNKSIEDTQVPNCEERLVHLDNVRQLQLEILPMAEAQRRGGAIYCFGRSQSVAVALSISQPRAVCLRSGCGFENERIGSISPVASIKIDANGQLSQRRAKCLL